MPVTTVSIRKMHCKSCTLLVERALLEVPGVRSVSVDLRLRQAKIHADGPLDIGRIEQAVREAGYDVGGEEHRAWLTSNLDEYAYLAMGGFFVLALWLLASRTGVFAWAMNAPGGGGLAAALVLGLTAGVSTCMGLVGGLVLGTAARHAERHPEATRFENFRPHLFFHVGRIGGFFVLGGLLGELGSLVSLNGTAFGVVTIAVAIVMLLLGLQLTEISPALGSFALSLPTSVSRALGIHRRHEREYNHASAAFLGAMTFFLPCGFTQMMQMSAIASRGFVPGGLIMAAFAIGTAPGLLGIAGLTSVLRGVAAKVFFKAAGLVVIALGIFNLMNGYRLTGWELPWYAPDAAVATQNIVVERGVQVARMRESWDGYTPNEFVVRAGVPVRWVIDAQAPNSCAGSISAPGIGVLTTLHLGENIIEFTPAKPGTIRFTCGMGMYPGRFTVIP